MNIVLKNRSDVPIYEQIEAQLREMILAGQLMEGEQLPSIRQLARDLRISVVTTTRVYSDLTEQGFLVSEAGRGCYVAPRDNELLRERMLGQMESALDTAARCGREAGLKDSEITAALQSALAELDREGSQ